MKRTDRSIGNGVSQISRLYRISGKELIEILRDRRTIITLVLMPLLVYPLLGIVVQKLTLQNLRSPEIIYRLGFENEAVAEEFVQLLGRGDQIAERLAEKVQESETSQQRDQDRLDGPSAASTGSIAGNRNPDSPADIVKFTFFTSGELSVRELIQEGSVDLGVIKANDDTSDLRRYQLIYNDGSKFSYDALQYVGRRLRLLNDEYIRQIVKSVAGTNALPGSYVEIPIKAAVSQQPALLTFVPLMLVLMTITGAVYPAIDLTAGERERGTMEILVAAPISRLVLLFGKFVAVLTVAMLTAVANLIAMVITIYSIGLDSIIFGQSTFSVLTIIEIFLLLFVLAAFFSATLLGLTSFARSFKEAQAYLIPLMLIAFAPGLLSLNPSLQTNSLLAIIPLVNVVLVGRDLLAGNTNILFVVIAITSTFFYGLFALSWAARIFGADSIMTGDQKLWSELFDQLRPWKPYPSLFTAMLFLAVLFPGFVVVSGLASNIATRMEATVEQRLWANALVTLLLFVCLPMAFAYSFRLMPKSTFRLNASTWIAYVAAVLLGISVWVIAYEIEVLSVSSQRIKQMMESFASLKLELNDVPLSVKLICLALVPAVCEEFTFRGFLFSAFQKRTTAVNTVVITAVLFGIFHVFVRDLLLFERLLPSTMMGLLLGFVCLRTGSVFPGMVLHVIHNGLLITLAHHEDDLTELGIGVAEQQHLPVTWILIALIPMAMGVTLLVLIRKTRQIPPRAAVAQAAD